MAYQATIYAITLSIIGVLLSFQGLWLTSRALWPARVQAAAARCRRNPIACFFVGLLVSGVTLLFVSIAARLGARGQGVAWVVFSGWFVFANIGVAGLVTHIGQRLTSPVDVDRPWRATVRGGIVLGLAWLPPVPGWVAILPVSFILGAGAATLSFFRPRIDSASYPGAGAPTPYVHPYAPPFVPDPYAAGGEYGRSAAVRPAEPVEAGR